MDDLYYWLSQAWNHGNFTVPNNLKDINKEVILKALSNLELPFVTALGYSRGKGFSSFTKKLFPDKPDKMKFYIYLLSTIDKKYCTKCASVKDFNEFSQNKARLLGISDTCKQCVSKYGKHYRENNKEFIKYRQIEHYTNNKKYYLEKWVRRECRKSDRTPKWLTAEHISQLKEIYRNCPIGSEVDHVLPLSGSNVSGLHVPWNLQYLSQQENREKSNKVLQ